MRAMFLVQDRLSPAVVATTGTLDGGSDSRQLLLQRAGLLGRQLLLQIAVGVGYAS